MDIVADLRDGRRISWALRERAAAEIVALRAQLLAERAAHFEEAAKAVHALLDNPRLNATTVAACEAAIRTKGAEK